MQKSTNVYHKYSDVSATEFNQLMNDRPDALLLDVRTPAEVQQQVLDGALNIDFMQPDFAQQVAGLDKNKTYLVYCRSGNRSGQACQLMAQQGFSDLYNLSGGLIKWPY